MWVHQKRGPSETLGNVPGIYGDYRGILSGSAEGSIGVVLRYSHDVDVFGAWFLVTCTYVCQKLRPHGTCYQKVKRHFLALQIIPFSLGNYELRMKTPPDLGVR